MVDIDRAAPCKHDSYVVCGCAIIVFAVLGQFLGCICVLVSS